MSPTLPGSINPSVHVLHHRSWPELGATVFDGTLDGSVVLALSGELCSETVPALDAQLERWRDGCRASTIVIDTHAVRFIDGRGIGLLVRLFTERAAGPAHVVLGRTSPCVSRLLAICDLSYPRLPGSGRAFDPARDGRAS